MLVPGWRSSFLCLLLCFLLGVDRPEFTGSNSWLKADESSVGDDKDDDHNSDNGKHLPGDYYAHRSKHFMYFNSLILTGSL